MTRQAKKIDWTPLRGEKNVYVRDYGEGQVFMLQGMHQGTRYTDVLGAMPLEQVIIIRETLRLNRKGGTPPLTYKDMIAEKAEVVRAEKVVQVKQRKVVLQEEDRRIHNTVVACWEGKYWPYRLNLRRSAKETASIDGRWRNFLRPFFGDMPIEDVEKKHFDTFVQAMRQKTQVVPVKVRIIYGRGKKIAEDAPRFRLEEKDTGLPYSDTVIHKCLADMRTFWHFAMEHEFVKKVFPGRAITKEVHGEIDNEKMCYLDYDEAKELADLVFERRLNSRLDHDTYCYTVLGLCLGLRAGDIHKLNQQAVERHIIDRTKNKRARFVHFGFGPVRAMLDERLSLYPPADPLQPLFLTDATNSKGKMRTEVPHVYFEIIKELAFNEKPKRFGHALEKIDFHALRHTFATFAAMAGVDQYTLMKLMGHKKPDMTNRYIEIADAHQAENLEKALPALFPSQAELGTQDVRLKIERD